MTPVFFGTALGNFGVDQVPRLHRRLGAAATAGLRRPRARGAGRRSSPASCSKIQANMDLKHRDHRLHAHLLR